MNTTAELLVGIEENKRIIDNHKRILDQQRIILRQYLFELMEKLAHLRGVEVMLLTSPNAIYTENPSGKSQKLICPELANVFYDYWHYIRPNAVSWSKKNGWKEL